MLSLLPFLGGWDAAGSLTSSEGREANTVLFRSGEGESVKRATTSAEAPACISTLIKDRVGDDGVPAIV